MLIQPEQESQAFGVGGVGFFAPLVQANGSIVCGHFTLRRSHAGASFTANSVATLLYDKRLLDEIRLRYGSFVRAPGGWNLF